MTDYVKSTNFTSKDSLATGNPLKIVKGAEFDTEFNAIATAIATKADLASPALSGVPTAPTAATGTNTTQVSTTAFVKNAVDAYDSALTVSTSQIEDSAVTTAKIADDNVTTDKLADASVTIPKIDATGTASATTFLRGDGVWASGATDVQTFNSSGTWTKPSSGQTMARIQLWGGGGGSYHPTGAPGTAGPGGGGGYNEVTVPLSYLNSSVAVTVGAGGVGAVDGGTSSITLNTAVAGYTTYSATGGTKGATGVSGTGGKPNGWGYIPTVWKGGDYNESVMWGGAGGAASGGQEGFSLYGGNGGLYRGNGAAPGGGGGGSSYTEGTTTSGGNGRVIITCW